MSQYGAPQTSGQQQGYGGQQQEQDPSSQQGQGQEEGQYGAQEPQEGYGQEGQHEEGAEGQYGNQQEMSDPSAMNGVQDHSSQPNGAPQVQPQGQHSKPGQQAPHPQQPNGIKLSGGDSKQQNGAQDPHGEAGQVATQGQKKPVGQAGGAPQKWGTGRDYHKTHHNAMYHMSQTANNGFTKDHMDSFLHLGTYALGALANQHSLAPAAMHPDGN